MTTAAPEHVVIVGAGLGGVRTLERLRAGGYTGRITLVGAEPHAPYDRPPLSKQILHGDWEPEHATLRDASALSELSVAARLGSRAVALVGTTVALENGERVTGDAVVIATGSIAQRLPAQPEGMVTLRGLDDALALKRALDSARSLIVVGAGFIGAEVAWSARRRGIQVTVLETRDAPCTRVFGPQVGELAARLFTEAGVDLRCGVQVTGLKGGHTVELGDRSVVSADVVLVSVGAVPDLRWLDGQLPRAGGGVACDENGRVTGASGVWAVGDAAAWWDPGSGTFRRSEHWTSAVDQANRAACDIIGARQSEATAPYVWSDQFGLKVQVLGRTEEADEVRALHGQGLAGGAVKGTVVGYFTSGVLSGVVSFGAPALLMRYRALLASGAKIDAVLARADGQPAQQPTAVRSEETETTGAQRT